MMMEVKHAATSSKKISLRNENVLFQGIRWNLRNKINMHFPMRRFSTRDVRVQRYDCFTFSGFYIN